MALAFLDRPVKAVLQGDTLPLTNTIYQEGSVTHEHPEKEKEEKKVDIFHAVCSPHLVPAPFRHTMDRSVLQRVSFLSSAVPKFL